MTEWKTVEANPAELAAITDRIVHAKADSTLILIDNIVTALRDSGIDIDIMADLCRSAVSGQFNDPAAAFALAEYTHDTESDGVKREAMKLMIEDERHDQTTTEAD